MDLNAVRFEAELFMVESIIYHSEDDFDGYR